MMLKKRGKKGFSLIEILVVIVIVALLATMFVVGLGGTEESVDATRLIEGVRTLKSAYIAYYADTHRDPPLTPDTGMGVGSDLVASLGRYAQKPLDKEILAFGPILIQKGKDVDGIFIGFLGGKMISSYMYNELLERAGTFELRGAEGETFAADGSITMRVR